MPSSPQPGQRHQTGSLDETLVSLGAGVGEEELPLERGDLIGRYIILEEIGRGAMGVVLGAYDPQLDRRIALKLMPVAYQGEARARSGASARLQREAQAMARLSHPNVITVHDVGSTGEEIFIAMEFIEGGSLREWLGARKRSWDELLPLFIDAGEGLAAAHRQGIVHRDFKPDNVLVRADGRACVGDFGLARRDVLGSAEDELSLLRVSTPGTLDGMTMTGVTMGTPAYMAPEQHQHGPIDARADQFAFCVALWEALCGDRPFAGTTLAAIAGNVTKGQREAWPSGVVVPPRIRAALERGLAIDPEARFASMDALIAELRAASSTRRRPWWAIGITTAALGVASVALLARPAPPVVSEHTPAMCSRAAEQLEGIWTPAQREATRAAFSATGLPYAARSFTRAAATLDAQREAWITSHTTACEATRIYGEQSEELLDRRMVCLSARRSELAAVSAALAEAQPDTLRNVDKLLAAIAPVAGCNDLAALEVGVAAPPLDARPAVESLRADMAQLRVDRRRVADGDLLERAAALVARAEALAHAPALAEALTVQAQLHEARSGPEVALPIARRAVAIASAAEHRRALAEALTLVAWLEGGQNANFELGMWLLELAEAESERLGHPPFLAIRIASDRASLFTIAGKYDAGLAEFERALAIAELELGAEHMRAADLRFNIAATQLYLDHHVESERGFREALEVYTALTGPDHPEVAQCHSNLAASLSALGRGEEAEGHARRAVEIWEQTGSERYLPGGLNNLAEAIFVQGDYARALPYARDAHASKLEQFGPEHPTTLEGQSFVARLQLELGELELAERALDEAIAGTRSSAPEHPMLFEMRMSLAELRHAQTRDDEAIAALVAIEADARAAGIDARHYVFAATLLRAELEHARGRDARAREALAALSSELPPNVDRALAARLEALRAQLEQPSP